MLIASFAYSLNEVNPTIDCCLSEAIPTTPLWSKYASLASRVRSLVKDFKSLTIASKTYPRSLLQTFSPVRKIPVFTEGIVEVLPEPIVVVTIPTRVFIAFWTSVQAFGLVLGTLPTILPYSAGPVLIPTSLYVNWLVIAFFIKSLAWLKA